MEEETEKEVKHLVSLGRARQGTSGQGFRDKEDIEEAGDLESRVCQLKEGTGGDRDMSGWAGVSG